LGTGKYGRCTAKAKYRIILIDNQVFKSKTGRPSLTGRIMLVVKWVWANLGFNNDGSSWSIRIIKQLRFD
jgi:hypothetical protein